MKGMRGNWLPGNQLDEPTDGEDTGEWGHKEAQVTVGRWLLRPNRSSSPPDPQIRALKSNHQGNNVRR